MSTPTIDSAANVLADPSAHADEPRLHAALTRSALSPSEGGVFVATVEVRRTMTADPQQVYELIADVTRMVEWSPESAGAEWLTGEPGAVGSTFRGDNRRTMEQTLDALARAVES